MYIRLAEQDYKVKLKDLGFYKWSFSVDVVEYVDISYDFAVMGVSMRAYDSTYNQMLREQMTMLVAMYGGSIANRLTYGPNIAPIYSEKSALDILEKNGWLTPGQQKALYQKWGHIPTVDTFDAPPMFHTTLGGNPTVSNGTYTITPDKMEPHKTGRFENNKSQFLSSVDAEKAVLDGASYADKNGLWDSNNQATIYVKNGPVGILGDERELTNFLKITRTNNNIVHGWPGTP